jgi:acetyl esterase/lipase
MIHTFIYKSVNDCPIRLDVYPVEGTAPAPVLVCIHGGALIWGSRSDTESGGAARLRELCAEEGYTQVSIDYRLAPETKLPAIIEDIKDAWLWCHHELPRLFDVDTKRIGILGRSAGGYLTLMAGFCVDPRPGALVSLYGYGDIAGSWYSEPSPFYLSQPRISTESAYQVVGSDTIAETVPDQERWRFYLYCRQRGIWIQEVTGLDPMTDSTSLRAYRPIRNISRDYPATLLIHGTNDTDVPYQQSADMASAIQAKGRAVELMPIPGGAHAFDEAIATSDLAPHAPSPAAQSFQRIIRFLGKWLN